MGKKIDKQIYKLYKTVFYHSGYRQLAKRYAQAVNDLQTASQTFSGEQWEALREYQSATSALCCQMVELALRKRR